MKRRDFLAGTATGVALGAGALALSACGEIRKKRKKQHRLF
jgi:gas vesicle protein